MAEFPNDTHISENFKWSELGVPDPANAPDWVRSNLKFLCDHILEPIREHFGVAITVDSGYRSTEEQAELFRQEVEKYGGDEAQAEVYVARPGHSQHNFAKAADIVVPGHTPAEVKEFAMTLPQVGGVGLYPGFTHVDFRDHTDGVIAQWP